MINWKPLAQRLVQGVGVRPGELIVVRDDSGRFDLLLELLLTIEKAGATPLPQITPVEYMERLWQTAPASYLARWDAPRQPWLQQADRIIVLAGASPDFRTVPEAALRAWETAEQRLTAIEEARQLPYLLAAIPTERRAQALGLTLAQLEQRLLPALETSVADLYKGLDAMQTAVSGAHSLIIQTGAGCELHLALGKRPWLSDDGFIDDDDRARGAIVSNLPAGSLYTTVLEAETRGTLWLPQAGVAQDVTLTFGANGRITDIVAASGGETLVQLFDRHTGEPRRVGHIGIGLNPHLAQPIGWTLVDEHVRGHLFISFGENRYMGGANDSSLNIDFAVPEATLVGNGRRLIDRGKLRVYTT